MLAALVHAGGLTVQLHRPHRVMLGSFQNGLKLRLIGCPLTFPAGIARSCRNASSSHARGHGKLVALMIVLLLSFGGR